MNFIIKIKFVILNLFNRGVTQKNCPKNIQKTKKLSKHTNIQNLNLIKSISENQSQL